MLPLLLLISVLISLPPTASLNLPPPCLNLDSKISTLLSPHISTSLTSSFLTTSYLLHPTITSVQEEHSKIKLIKSKLSTSEELYQPNLSSLDTIQSSLLTYSNLKTGLTDLPTLGSILLLSKITLPPLIPSTVDLKSLKTLLSSSLIIKTTGSSSITLNPSKYPSLSLLLKSLESTKSHLSKLIVKHDLQQYGDSYITETGSGKRVGSSRSGKTIYRIPKNVESVLERLKSLEKDVEIEERDIINDLSLSIDFKSVIEFLADVVYYDTLLARSKCGGCLPTLTSSPLLLNFDNLNPLLPNPKVLKKFELKDKVITGSNNLGKTVLLDTIAITIYFTYSGLPIQAEGCEVGVFNRIEYIKDGKEGDGGSYFNVLKEYNNIKGGDNDLILLDEGGGFTEEEVGGKVLDGYLKKWKGRHVVTTHNSYLRKLRSSECIHFIGKGEWIEGEGGARFEGLKGVVDEGVLEGIDVDWESEEIVGGEIERIKGLREEEERRMNVLEKKIEEVLKGCEESLIKVKKWEDNLSRVHFNLNNTDHEITGSTLDDIKSTKKKIVKKIERFRDGIDLNAQVSLNSRVFVTEGDYVGELGICVGDEVCRKLIEFDFGGGVRERVWVEDWKCGVFSERGGNLGEKRTEVVGAVKQVGEKKKGGNPVKSSRERKAAKKR